jgi:DNA-binding GntR family transcriptional regulator
MSAALPSHYSAALERFIADCNPSDEAEARRLKDAFDRTAKAQHARYLDAAVAFHSELATTRSWRFTIRMISVALTILNTAADEFFKFAGGTLGVMLVLWWFDLLQPIAVLMLSIAMALEGL